jgi:hypothetical protein
MKLAGQLILAFVLLAATTLIGVGDIVFDHYHPVAGLAIHLALSAVVVLGLSVLAWRWWRQRNSN